MLDHTQQSSRNIHVEGIEYRRGSQPFSNHLPPSTFFVGAYQQVPEKLNLRKCNYD